MKTHMRNLRLHNNAGMAFPDCYARARLLDLDKNSLLTTTNRELVTCERCKKIRGFGSYLGGL